MGVIERVRDILAANINELIDKAEDPVKMCNQQLRKYRDDLAYVKSNTADVMAIEKKALRNLDECKAKVDKYAAAAANAVKAGNDDDARKLIASKQEEEQNLALLQAEYDDAHANSEQMKQAYNKLVSDIETLERTRTRVESKMARAKSQETINSMASTGKRMNDTKDTMSRMEAKADRMLDKATAAADLDAEIESGSASALADKYTGASSTSVEDELAALKAQVNS